MVAIASTSSEPAWQAELDSGRCIVDMHCHCLPGVDDGPATMAQALELCRLLVADGITHAIATPHQLGRYDGTNSAGRIREAVASLQGELQRQQIPLVVLPGADVRIDERLPRLLREDQVMTLGDCGKYLMLELPHEIFVDPRMMLDQLRELGYRTIISHPERHYHVQRDFRCVLHWLERHAVLQITAGSLLGEWGPDALRTAWDLLSSGYAAVIASDAHNASSRPPCMRDAMEVISARLGAATAQSLCVQNPVRLLKGEDVLPLGRMVVQARGTLSQ